MDGAKGIYPEFAGNVKTMEARGFWRDSASSPSTQGYHYNWNAETYLLVGDALGRGMIDLLASTPAAGTFAAWQAANATAGAISADHDGDGVANGIEWFLGGTTGQTALPTVAVEGGATCVTWTKAAAYTGAYGTGFVVETSETLTGTWTAEPLGGSVTITGSEVKFTFSPASTTKRFARLKVYP